MISGPFAVAFFVFLHQHFCRARAGSKRIQHLVNDACTFFRACSNICIVLVQFIIAKFLQIRYFHFCWDDQNNVSVVWTNFSSRQFDKSHKFILIIINRIVLVDITLK